ncbi:MAG TPA: hypothetical protein VIG99_02595 [Myxococcaceae bacterium]|jgi:hypothetical protein
MMKSILGGLAGAVLLTACGGSDPGSGTQTLYVEVTAASDGSSDGTAVYVVVRDGSSSAALVEDAQVTLIGDRGTTYTPGFTSILGIGLGYYKNQINWEGGWRVRIVRGNDNLEAYVAGPGLTEITAPVASSTFMKSSAQNLSVQWRDENGRAMPNASIKFRRAQTIDRIVQDTGSYSVDFNELVAANDERITLKRWTEVALRGGVTGSKFKAETTDELNLTVQQQ